MKKVGFLAGVSGVGKSTFLGKFPNLIQFELLSAGKLIRLAKTDYILHDELRSADLGDNQELLVRALNVVLKRSDRHILMDGHVIIDSSDSVHCLDLSVFERLSIGAFAHLSAPSEQIKSSRVADSERQRPDLPVDVLASHQNLSLKHSKKIAQALDVPFQNFARDEFAEAEHFFSSCLNVF